MSLPYHPPLYGYPNKLGSEEENHKLSLKILWDFVKVIKQIKQNNKNKPIFPVNLSYNNTNNNFNIIFSLKILSVPT